MFANAFVFSQQNKERKEMRENQNRWDKIEELKKFKMLDVLNLSEDESFKFYSRYNTFRSQTREIEKERKKLLDEMEAIMSDKKNESELLKKLDELEKIDQRFSENRKNFFYDIKNILPLEKVVKYILFERSFQRELQNILRDVQRRQFRDRKP
jgi:hypothetical protein